MAKNIVILGAGITGLSVAQTLSSHGFKVDVIERESKVGGIIKGFKVGRYTFDHGPHAILTRNKAAFEQFQRLIKNDLISIGERRAGVYFKGKHYQYPLKPTTVFRHSSPLMIAKTLGSFLYYNGRRVLLKPKEHSFEEYIIDHFGKELYEQFFKNYTKKVWNVSPSKLAASFAAERIQKISFSGMFRDFIKKLSPRPTPTKFSETMMYYPQHGVSQIPELLEKEIKESGGRIHLNSTVIALYKKNSNIRKVEYAQRGARKTILADYVISTIPITLLVKAIRPRIGREATQAAVRLQYKRIKFLFLVVNKPKVFDEHWVYFHDSDNLFYRIFDTSAFSTKLMPKGKTGLIIELSTKGGKKDEELYKGTIKTLGKHGLIKGEDVEAHYFDELEHGYPIYSLTYKKDLETIFQQINNITNLVSAGRQGLFRYLDMDHCIRFGPAILDIIQNNRDKGMDQIIADHGKKTY
jgi:protoporphyrinogen oxidase